MTIEGGCFTTALLKKHHITELFEEPSLEDSNSGAPELAHAKNSNKPFSDATEQEKENSELEVIVENLPAKATISPNNNNNKESAQFEAVINLFSIFKVYYFCKFPSPSKLDSLSIN